MKYPFRANIIVLICALLVACGQASQLAPTSSATALPTGTLAPSQTATALVVSTPTYVPPTLIPTIDPKLVPGLLSKSISIQTLKGINGHNIKRITGWNYGFRQKPCYGYQWLDSNHLLLYPRTGQWQDGFYLGQNDSSSELIVINLTNENLWLQQPLSSEPISFWGLDCSSVYLSRELGIIISQENSQAVDGSQKEDVIIYTFDGEEIARYGGKISGVSPKGTKVMVNDDTIIDLRNNKITNLAWHIDRDRDYSLGILPKLYWSSDETQVYRCCFYYANLNTGKSYNFEWSDLRGPGGKPLPYPMNSPHTDGQWVRNDTYFFPMWSYMSYGGDPSLIFSPAEKKYFFIEIPSTSIINPETFTYTISPDGMHVWIKGYGDDGLYHNFLNNLTTLKTVSFDIPIDMLTWSADGKFGWATEFDSNKAHVLSVASKKLLPFPVNPRYEIASWHPKDHILAYMAESDQTLALLNAEDMTVQGRELPVSVMGFLWSPNGDRMVFISKDRSLWQVDYPAFQNFEQLTEPMADINDIFWSPDGKSIAFISGSDIYIVDTNK